MSAPDDDTAECAASLRTTSPRSSAMRTRMHARAQSVDVRSSEDRPRLPADRGTPDERCTAGGAMLRSTPGGSSIGVNETT